MNARLNIVMPDELKKRLDNLARTMGVSVASLVNNMIRENLEVSRFEQIETAIAAITERVSALEAELFGRDKK